MDYVVTARIEPPLEQTGLDPLQQEGVAAVLDRQLALVEGVAGPSEEDIDVLDYRITVQSDSASVLLAMDAPALTAAEQAAATVLNELLAESDLLGSWTVADSEVRITEDEFNQSLAGAESDAPVGLGVASELEAAIEDALEEAPQAPAAHAEHWHHKLGGLAEQLKAFDLGEFGENEREAKLVAGALVHAVQVVTDELFYDELALSVNNASADEADGLLVLEELPPCYEHRYDALFTRALLLSSAAVATRLTGSTWVPPRTVAEALALRLFLNEARVLLEAAELMSWERSGTALAGFGERAFAGISCEELYEVDVPLVDDSEDERTSAAVQEVESKLRGQGLAFDQWFEVRADADEGGAHPYLRQQGS